jgi:hypothetical protein
MYAFDECEINFYVIAKCRRYTSNDVVVGSSHSNKREMKII